MPPPLALGLGIGLGFGGSIWTPESISGLVVDLNGDLGVTNDGTGKASAWADQSGNANNAAQATQAKRPTINAADVNGHTDLQFAVSTSVMTIADAASLKPSALTVFVVANQTTLAGFAALLTKTTTSAWTDGWGFSNVSGTTDGKFAFWVNAYNVVGQRVVLGAVTANTWHVFDGSFDGTTVAGALDGAESTTAYSAAITSSAAAMAVGGDNAAALQESLTGKLARVLMYNRALTSAEKSQVRAYLKARYGTP